MKGVRRGRCRTNGEMEGGECGYGPDTWVTDQTGDMGDSGAERSVIESREAGDESAARSETESRGGGDEGAERSGTGSRETGDRRAGRSATSSPETGERVVDGVADDVRDMGDSERAGWRDALEGNVAHG